MLRSMGSQRVGHGLAAEQQQPSSFQPKNLVILDCILFPTCYIVDLQCCIGVRCTAK